MQKQNYLAVVVEDGIPKVMGFVGGESVHIELLFNSTHHIPGGNIYTSQHSENPKRLFSDGNWHSISVRRYFDQQVWPNFFIVSSQLTKLGNG